MSEQDESNVIEFDDSLLAPEEAETPEESPPLEEALEHTQSPEAEIPDKYKGKSAMEIIKMHQDAERLLGRQGSEVGQLRKIVDDLVDVTNKAQPSPAPEQPEEVDFFADPQKATTNAVKSVLDSDPRLQALEKNLVQSEKQQAQGQILAKHPEAPQIVNNPEFVQWISQSAIRTQMFQEANQGLDVAKADELFSLWKDRESLRQTTSDNAKANRGNDLKRAATGSGKASAGTPQKPKLSREALVKLKAENPSEYMRLLPMIKQAYLEKRAI